MLSPLFGAWLVEAISDDTLLALSDPLDLDRNGVSGRAAVIEDVATGDLRVGRFGWKSQQPTLIAFWADAYLNEMGITSDLFPNEQSFGISPELMRLCDPIPDPEDIEEPATGRRGIDNFEAFMQVLALIGRGPIDDPRSGRTSCCSTPSGAPPATCRCSKPVQAPTRWSTAGPSRCTRTCSCMLSAPVTASDRRRPRRTRFARQRCGGAVPASTVKRRPRGDRHRRHPGPWRRARPCPAGVRRPRPHRSCRPAGLPRLALRLDLRS